MLLFGAYAYMILACRITFDKASVIMLNTFSNLEVINDICIQNALYDRYVNLGFVSEPKQTPKIHR